MQQYKALYRENRPEVFDQILGQEHIVKILKHQIATDTVSHAYLFCGTRGTGKTTTARILAKAVNCTNEDVEARPCGECDNCRAIADGVFMDVIEIDAASNTGVDDIRELRESVKYPPAVGRKKVYIIDEVHMLSTQAFNALLKTLEEPPENVMFILATTDPEKLPQTVLSRCMRLDFKRVPAPVIMDNMKAICAKNGVEISDGALRLLASNADGSVRDSLSILEQCLSSGEKTLDRDTVLEFLGAVSEEFYLELTEKVLTHNVSEALVLLDDALQEGKDVKQLMKDWMAHYRNLLIAQFVSNPEDMLNMSSENIKRLKDQSSKVELAELNRSIITLAKLNNDARYSSQARILMEVAIVTIATGASYGDEVAAMPKTTVRARAQRPAAKAAQPKPAEAGKSENVESAAGPDDKADNKPASEEQDPEDLAELWNEIADVISSESPSTGAYVRRATLAELGDNEFKVIVDNDFAKDKLEKEQIRICQLMEEHTGKTRRLACKLQGQSADESDDQNLKMAVDAAENILGTKVEIK